MDGLGADVLIFNLPTNIEPPRIHSKKTMGGYGFLQIHRVKCDRIVTNTDPQ
jgi:hypothetical protein